MTGGARGPAGRRRLPGTRLAGHHRAVEKIEVSAGIGAFILHAAAAKGVSAAALAEATGFDPARAGDPDARIPLALEVSLWNEAARRCEDDAFGLHAAELVRPGMFDVMDYAIRTAPTLRDSFLRLVRYNCLVHDVAEFTLREEGDTARLEHAFRTLGAAPCRHAAEFTLAVLVVVADQITGVPLRPRSVEFRHGKPSSKAAQAAHLALFGAEPRFAQRVNAFEVDRTALDRVLPAADPALSRLVERHAETLVSARPVPAASTGDRVRRVLASALGEGHATLAGVAARLRMSERSLQRKLAEEDLAFEALVDAMRRDLALRYLADPKIAVAEVAYLLGYSEPSPFHRAFKRWTGVTPTEARRRAA